MINRMLAKDPAERYASYPELIEHLSYARTKLLELNKRPYNAKERLVIETFAMKNVPLSLGGSILIASILVACVLASYIFRNDIFGTSVQRFPPVSYSGAQLEQGFRSAVQLLARRQAQKALKEFDRLVPLPGNQQPIKNWIGMNGALAALVGGEPKDAARRFGALAKENPYSTAEKDRLLATFFLEASKQLAKTR